MDMQKQEMQEVEGYISEFCSQVYILDVCLHGLVGNLCVELERLGQLDKYREAKDIFG